MEKPSNRNLFDDDSNEDSDAYIPGNDPLDAIEDKSETLDQKAEEQEEAYEEPVETKKDSVDDMFKIESKPEDEEEYKPFDENDFVG